MSKLMITFGQNHTHRINGKTLDCDCVGVITADTHEEADRLAFEWFDGKFHQHVPDTHWDDDSMKYYPRGYVEIN